MTSRQPAIWAGVWMPGMCGYAVPHGARSGALGDDQTGRGALRVVDGHQLSGDSVGVRPVAGQGRHHQAVVERAVDRVIRIQELYAAGLNSTKIGQILPCMRDADGGPNVRATPALVG